jgi:DNA-binding transcriptional ArsR family regulator
LHELATACTGPAANAILALIVMADARRTDETAQPYRLRLHPSAPTSEPAHDCVVALKALGEETRVRIVGLLVDAPLDVNEIARRLDVSQYNVSKHLRILREAGLVEVEKAGRQHRYALPSAMRPRAAQSSVLDLGCCSFQFRDAAAGRQPLTVTRRKSTRGGSSR